MNETTLRRQEQYDREWNGWKADGAQFDQVRRYGQIAEIVRRLQPRWMLDVGCGDGRLARAIRSRCPGVQIHGCDLSGAALARSSGLDRHERVDLDGGRLPAEDAQFDLVIASEVLEHLVHPDRAVAECARVLQPGGHLLVTVPNVAFWRFRLQALLGDVPSVTADERHLHSFNAASLRRLVEGAGLETAMLSGLRQRFEWLGPLHYRLLTDTLLIVGRKA